MKISLTCGVGVFLGCVLMFCFSSVALSQATLTSDKYDYLPGTTATLTGAGFLPGENVTVQVGHTGATPDTGADHQPWVVVVDGNGGFVTTWHVCEDDCLGELLKATADGQTSGLHAEVFFWDATSWSFTISPTSSAVSVTQTYTFTATNTGTGNIGCITDTIHSVFTPVGSPTIVSSSGKSWTISRSGNVITVTANSNPDRLVTGETVVFTSDVTAPASGTGSPFTWGSNAIANTNCTGASYPPPDGGQPAISMSGCAPPNITGNPGNQTICVGSPASFSVTATGTGLTYQWRKDGVSIGGATSSTYSIPSAIAGDAGSYDVMVSGTCTPPDTSTAATLTVNTPPNITGNPSNQTVCVGLPASFSVTATGTGLTYQWRKDGINIGGATSSTYSIPSVIAGDAGSYDVIVSGTCTPPDTSTAATLTVNTPPSITGNPGNQTVCVGSPASFSVTATGTSITYQWRKDGVNIGGATSSTYSIPSAIAGDAGSYDVIVSGTCTASDTSTAATLAINTSPNITGNPGNQTICVGSPASFSVTATGTGLTYQWRKDGINIGGATSSTYSIPSAIAGDAGSYDVIVSGSCTPSDTSTAATLTINTSPNITGHPSNQTVCVGLPATFSVTATGTGLTYQWRKDGVNIGGATSSTYSIPSAISGDAGSYDVIVSGTCTPPDTSSAATLTISTGVNITANPGNQTVCVGSPASFTVTATGASLTYQWRKDGVNIGGATSSSYSISSVVTGDAGSYDVIVSSGCGVPDTSTAAPLTVNTPPSITGNPTNQTVCIGLPASFTVTATGTNLTYQWRKDGVNIGGATSSTYSIPSVIIGDAGSYDVIVSGTCTPPDTSTAATLTVNTPPTITGNPSNQTVCVGLPASFSVTATGTSLTYQWRKNGVDIGGATNSSYTISSVVAGDAGSYDVIVSGTCTPPDTSTAATLTVNTSPNITGNPGNQTVCVGLPASFSVTATGTGLAYQWRKDGVNISGATSSGYSISSVVTGDAGSYDVIVSGTCTPPDTSTVATLTVNTPPNITGNPGDQTVCIGLPASFTVTATGSSLTYQWRKNGIDIGGATSSSYTISSVVAGDFGSYDVIVSGTCTPPDTSTAATLSISTGVNITGNPANQTACIGSPIGFSVTATGASLTYQWRKDGVNIGGATSSSYNIASVTGGDAGSYDVIVSSGCGSPDTSTAATLTVNTPPNITGNPSNQIVCVGLPASFSVTATGTSLTYQWRKNGVNISGATSSTYSIPSVITGDAGSYDVIVSGTCTPPDTSTAATLTINTSPNITGNPGNQTICVGSPASFSVTATGTSLTYQWRKDGVNIGGATSSTYSIPSAIAGDTGSYDVIVSGTCTPPDTSTAATLTVNTPPNITGNPGNQTICVGSPASFSVTATGTGLTYQWRKDGINIGGATSSTYSIPSAIAGDAGSYDVIVSGTCTPPDTSTAATLTINTSPNITGNPSNQTVCVGLPASFSVTATGTGLTYQWRKDGLNIGGATNSSYTISSVVAGDLGSYDVVVSGTCAPPDTSTAATLTISTGVNITGNPANQTVCIASPASFSVTATGASLTYQWRKDGVNIGGATSSSYTISSVVAGDSGSYDVIVSSGCGSPDTSTVATLTVNISPTITGNPGNQTVCVGLPASFSITATGTGLTYQWRKDGVNISGATSSSYSIASVTGGNAGSYDVIVSGTCTPPDTSTSALLTVNTSPNITSNPGNQTVCVGLPASFSVTATGTSLTYQWRKDGVPIGGATSSSYNIASVTGGDAGLYDVIVSGTCTPPDTSTAATLSISTGVNITGNPAAQTVCAGVAVNFAVTATGASLTYQWRKDGVNLSDGGSIAGATTPTLAINPTIAGDAGSYDVIVSSGCGLPDTSTSALLTVNTSPNITSNPGNQTVCVGLPASFSVTATGTGLTYQWRKGGVNIGGATSSSYTIASVAGGDAGSYDVIVNGICTSPDTSTAAILTVNAPPSIVSHPLSISKVIAESVAFTVTATGTGLTYQWRKNGISIGGATGASYTISSVVPADSGAYDVIVSNSCTPPDTSDTAILTVLPSGQVQFISNLTLTSNCPGPSPNIKLLYFGVHPIATYCINNVLGENELLPPPPAGTFDARFIDSRTTPGACLGQGLITDLRQYITSSQVDTYKVYFQPAGCGYPITVAWSDLNSRYTGPVTLRDTLGGSIVNVNMKSQASYVVTDTTINQLYIIAEQPSDASLSVGRYRTFDQTEYSQKIRFWQKKYWVKAGDVRDETFMRKGWFRNGLYLGIPRHDSAKYGWIYWKRNVYRLPRFLPQTGPARALDYYVSVRKMWHRSRYNPAAKYHDNHLVGEQFILKFNVGASDVGITPAGFGDLIFDDATLPGNPCNGKAIREIMAHTDTALTYGHLYAANYYIALDSCLSRINRAFLGPIDTFTVTPMTVSGARSLGDVPYLHPNPSPQPVSVWDGVEIPDLYEPATYSLSQNYPNPFNPTTTIQFSLAEEALVTLTVYNMLGQEVTRLLDQEEMADGIQEIEFNSQGLASGVYFYRIVAVDPGETGESPEKFSVIKKMVLMK